MDSGEEGNAVSLERAEDTRTVSVKGKFSVQHRPFEPENKRVVFFGMTARKCPPHLKRDRAM
jgi:hypothetical protein